MKIDKKQLAELLNLHSMVDDFDQSEVTSSMVNKINKVIEKGLKKDPSWDPMDTSDYSGLSDDLLLNALVEVADQLDKAIVESKDNDMNGTVTTINKLKRGAMVAAAITSHIGGNYKASTPLMKKLRSKVIPNLSIRLDESNIELDHGEFDELAGVLNTSAQSLADEVHQIITSHLSKINEESEEMEQTVKDCYDECAAEGYEGGEIITKCAEKLGLSEDEVRSYLGHESVMESDHEGDEGEPELGGEYELDGKKYKLVGISDDDDPVITLESEEEGEEDLEMTVSEFKSHMDDDPEELDDEEDEDAVFEARKRRIKRRKKLMEAKKRFQKGDEYMDDEGTVYTVTGMELNEEDDEEVEVHLEDEDGEEHTMTIDEMEDLEEVEGDDDEEIMESRVSRNVIKIQESSSGVRSARLKTFSEYLADDNLARRKKKSGSPRSKISKRGLRPKK